MRMRIIIQKIINKKNNFYWNLFYENIVAVYGGRRESNHVKLKKKYKKKLRNSRII